MEGFAHRPVTDLSGGEQQRVALARTLAAGPRLLLLDEPLAALDRSLRQELVIELRMILHETGIPAIYVTHDQEEAYTLADRLAVLMDGQIIQMGVPDEVYQNPANPGVASFLGLANHLSGTVIESGGKLTVETVLGFFETMGGQSTESYPPGAPVILVLRNARVNEGDTETAHNLIKGRIIDSMFREAGYQTKILTDKGQELQFLLSQHFSSGDQVQLEIPADQINLFLDETNA
jgi:ABC-type Fe3+/spermidine/putrescine transport system ATPase subunit